MFQSWAPVHGAGRGAGALAGRAGIAAGSVKLVEAAAPMQCWVCECCLCRMLGGGRQMAREGGVRSSLLNRLFHKASCKSGEREEK